MHKTDESEANETYMRNKSWYETDADVLSEITLASSTPHTPQTLALCDDGVVVSSWQDVGEQRNNFLPELKFRVDSPRY